MNLDGNVIKTEVPLGGIESIALDPNGEDVVVLKFKVILFFWKAFSSLIVQSESKPRIMMCRQADEMVDVISERIQKFQEDENMSNTEKEIYAIAVCYIYFSLPLLLSFFIFFIFFSNSPVLVLVLVPVLVLLEIPLLATVARAPWTNKQPCRCDPSNISDSLFCLLF